MAVSLWKLDIIINNMIKGACVGVHAPVHLYIVICYQLNHGDTFFCMLLENQVIYINLETWNSILLLK
jgi:hypothetical protein